MLYAKLQKYIYGLLNSELLFNIKLAIDLKYNGFIINIYDPCNSNKLVKGEIIIVVYHFEDIEVSHKDPF